MTSTPPSDNRFRVSAAQARDLVRQFGTPLYVVDEAHFRGRIREYLGAFRAAYPRSELSFATKANSTLALIAIAHREGCSIDVASEGELRAALAAGVPASACYFHGNNKTRAELAFAIEQGIGHIVLDHFGEIEMVAELGVPAGTNVILRLAPGVDPVTHHKISTGQADTKFGFNIADGSAEQATVRCLEHGLPLYGFHCHVGSQLLDPEAQRSGGELIASFAVEMKEKHGFAAGYLNVGGGLGVRYTGDEEPMPIGEYCALVVEAVRNALGDSGLDPILGQEPGRALVSESGVTLYTVGVVKTVPAPGRGSRTYVAVDGGLSDNPRPALYGSKYEIGRVLRGTATHTEPADPLDRLGNFGASLPAGPGTMTVTVSGKHCETDKLFEDVELPDDTSPGDVLQVLCTGAYNSSMASNYNRYPRPATVLIREDGGFSLIQRRETWEEMLAREIVPTELLP
ncbi:MAG TPA: diaminopimelate decarboxylase [Fimbriimonadaceae bacterium]|nr:diaminopimelate decarboxylase [Fimbriimonadaceae bacterium]